MGEGKKMPESGWLPIPLAHLPASIKEQLAKELPDVAQIVSYLSNEFERQTISTRFEMQHNDFEFRKWLYFQFENETAALFSRRFPKLEHVTFIDYASKIGSISQRYCQICRPKNASQNGFPCFHIPLRIPGKSRQAISPQAFKDYQSAVRERLNSKYAKEAQFHAYCLKLTFSLNPQSRERDLDNMTKTIVDATARALEFDDAKIHHIDAVKLLIPMSEESVIVSMSRSFLNSHDDVILKKYDLNWAGQEPLLDPRPT